MTTFSEATGRKVVSTSTADTVGVINGFVLDPATRSVAGLELHKTPERASLLPWDRLTAFGADAVTVGDVTALVESDERLDALSGKAHAVLRKRVLDTTGLQLGTVQDVDFDPESGAVVSLQLEDQQIPGPKLLGIGSYAVVVQA